MWFIIIAAKHIGRICMAVDKISFSASYAKTENGNYYKKKKTGKRIGTMVGLAAGVGIAALPTSQFLALGAASRMFPKSPGKMFAATYGILGAGIICIAGLFRALGGIPDNIINKKRRTKADHIA